MIFDGISVIYVLSLCLTVVIILVIFAQRQISRMRNNNARREPADVSSKMSRRVHAAAEKELESVANLRAAYDPNLTDTTTLNKHSNDAYVHRMIALDLITQNIDLQLERISIDYARSPGESTYAYLTRLRHSIMPNLDPKLINRISYLHELARFRPQKFDVAERMELQSQCEQFTNCFLAEQGRLVEAQQPQSKARNISDTIRNVFQHGSRRRPGGKFGGSDGGRLIAGLVSEERAALLSSTASPSHTPARRGGHARRLSDPHQL